MGDENNHLFRVSLFSIAFAGVDVDLTFFFRGDPFPHQHRSREEERRPKRAFKGQAGEPKKLLGVNKK
jgi:hypothetical protein